MRRRRKRRSRRKRRRKRSLFCDFPPSFRPYISFFKDNAKRISVRLKKFDVIFFKQKGKKICPSEWVLLFNFA